MAAAPADGERADVESLRTRGLMLEPRVEARSVGNAA